MHQLAKAALQTAGRRNTHTKILFKRQHTSACAGMPGIGSSPAATLVLPLARWLYIHTCTRIPVLLLLLCAPVHVLGWLIENNAHARTHKHVCCCQLLCAPVHVLEWLGWQSNQPLRSLSRTCQHLSTCAAQHRTTTGLCQLHMHAGYCSCIVSINMKNPCARSKRR
jgi:hypothetical protein